MKELASWGVKLAIYPVVAGNPALHAIRASLQTLKETGKDDTQAGGYSPRDFFDVMGLKHEEEIDRLAGGQAFALGA
jgi:2-methylisocitrate lyase-like PEP mutase family enzyme